MQVSLWVFYVALFLLIAGAYYIYELRWRERHYQFELLKAMWLLWSQELRRMLVRLAEAHGRGNDAEIEELYPRARKTLLELRLIHRAMSLIRGTSLENPQLLEVLRELGVANSPGFPHFPVVRDESVIDFGWRERQLEELKAATKRFDVSE